MHTLLGRLVRRFSRPTETLDGYEQPELIEVIFQKTKAYQPRGNWLEMAGVSSVLDFGGGCGLHYKQAQSSSVKWAVVETPVMVERAKELASNRLQFFSDISEAADWLGPIDVMHSNGALQYAADPEYALRQLCSLRAKRMIWERLTLSAGETTREIQTSFMGDNGPGSLRIKEKNVRYERIDIPETMFVDAHAEHMLTDRGNDWFRFLLR